MRKLVFGLLLLLSFSEVYAQTKISGKITGGAGNPPLPGVTVVVKGSKTGTTTDTEGAFSIAVPGPGTVLSISYIGYVKQEIEVGNKTYFDITLLEDATSLSEVVVTALGIQREKKSLGYAIQEIQGSALSDAKETNLANAFTGKVAGLQVVRSSNGAGGSSKIVLRGNTSLTGSNQPLIVVDGIPIDNFTGTTENGYWGAGLDLGNGLGDISAEDIESMSVLKGPSAAALYGSRAGNGVILITTKSGRKQPGLGITFSTTLGTENIFIKPELQNTFGQGTDNIYNAMNTTSWGPKVEGQSVTKWDSTQAPLAIHDNVNAFLRSGSSQNYSLGLQQQYGSTAVFASLNYLEDRSIIPGNKLTRLNFTSKATTHFGKESRWTSDIKMAYNNTSGYNRPINGRDNSSVFVLYMLPRSLDITDFSAATNEFGKMLWYPGAPGSQSNPYWLSKYNLNNDTRNRFIMNGSLKYAFTDWLDAEVKAGGDLYTTNTERKTYAGGPLSNSYSLGKQTFSETNYSALIKATKDEVFGQLGGTFTLGGNLMQQKYSSLTVNTGALEVPNLFTPTNSAAAPQVWPGYSRKKINSVYGSLGINYAGWIYFDVTARNDWSSALIEENRSYFYPSYSLSYVVTDMLDKMGTTLPLWINYAKLRGSYATVGNDLAPYQLYNGYNISKDPLSNTIAVRQSLLKSSGVRSELIKNLELGTELKLLNNRLRLDFTWYKSNATRQLIDIPMDPMSGYSNMKVNAGNIQNKGIEIMADLGILTKPTSLNWSLTANFSKNENKIIDIAKDLGVNEYQLGAFDDLFIRATTDGLYGDIYGTQFLRVKDQASPHFGKMVLTAEGLPQRDATIVKLGNQQAKGLLGISNNFSYQGIGLSFLIDARLGGEIFSASNVGLQSAGAAAVTAPGGERPEFVVDGVVMGEGDQATVNTEPVTQQQYWSTVSTLNNLGVGEAYVYDATNIRLRNVMLSYSLPKKLLGNTFQKAKISASANNVWMIKSHLKGIDPESVFATGTNAVGFENGGFPTMRSFLFSLTLGF
ncbi:SusC/RagA family TonB-linked outer membrane protein [Dyadobacter sp. CY343]|uniref:SusC/RagA family TonB-linked outer membrane protein n=1 Tax=Dyadobacter sp. CY343 TaxID=2907299 RepID=UPI001F1BCA35|nr:SusC/RagA family TonB-linked outer membrane protein [Dyadobacter sp. CY343]MCE7059742.1 SusC/RagA family TonB-linked outer membrane protein [Dyadobacter sp. CY343]